MRAMLTVLVLTALVACKRDSTAPETVVTASVFNRLDLSINLSAGGTNYGSLGSGQSTVLTLPPRTATLEWASSKRRFSSGSPVPDDLDGASVSISQNLRTIDISNIVNGTPYFSPRISLAFVVDTVSIELVQPTSQRCIGWQYGGAAVRWGYYRLDFGTTLRVYAGKACAGNWRYWTYDQLSGFDVGSGVVTLSVSQTPLRAGD